MKLDHDQYMALISMLKGIVEHLETSAQAGKEPNFKVVVRQLTIALLTAKLG